MFWMDSSFFSLSSRPQPPLPQFLSPGFLPLSSYLISMLRPVGAVSASCLHSSLLPYLSDIGSLGQYLSTNIAYSPWIQSSLHSPLPLTFFFYENRSSHLHGHSWLKVVLFLLSFLLPASSPCSQSIVHTGPKWASPVHRSNLVLYLTLILWLMHYLPDLS